MSIKHNRCTALAKHNYSPARNSFALRTARPYFSLQASKHPGVLAQAYLSKIGLKPYQNARLIGEMEANGLMEDEYSPDWLEDRINALAHLLGAAETDSPNGAAGNPFKPYFSLLLYNGGLALLKQDVAPMARRLEELSTALPGIDVLHVLCHVRQQCCGCTRTFKQGQPRINSFASRSLIAISTHEVPPIT